MNGRVFLDTNICIYLANEPNSVKKEIALGLIIMRPLISPQVVFECINVCRRKLKYDDEACLSFVKLLMSFCDITSENNHIVENALALWQKHQFQLFDAKIVATALEAGCHTLYSEDMHHGLVVNKSLTIVNPFI